MGTSWGRGGTVKGVRTALPQRHRGTRSWANKAEKRPHLLGTDAGLLGRSPKRRWGALGMGRGKGARSAILDGTGVYQPQGATTLGAGLLEAVLLELIANAWSGGWSPCGWWPCNYCGGCRAYDDFDGDNGPFLDHEDGLIALCLGTCQRPMTRMSAVMPSIRPVECALCGISLKFLSARCATAIRLAGATRMVARRLR